MFYFLYTIILILILIFMFNLSSKKLNWDFMNFSSFECGFSAYFFSRNSFSMNYFLMGLIFLFLDLELCFLMPFFNEEFSTVMTYTIFMIFIMALIMGLILEWINKNLDWKF